MSASIETPLPSMMDNQEQLELLFSKNQLIPRIRAEFENCQEYDFKAHMIEHKIPIDFGFALLVQINLHKRANLPTMVGVLRSHCEDSQATADMLMRAAIADLVDWDPELKLFIVKYPISADVQAELDRFAYPLPMVVPPRPIQDNRDSGYLLNKSSVILGGSANHHTGDVCLDHLNRSNQIKMSINLAVATGTKNSWANMDKPKPGESWQEFQKRKRAFRKYNRSVEDAIGLMVDLGNEFYFTHAIDKRGRTYCRGYQLSTQGNSYSKAILEFADKEIIE
jgi:hypothetical protein